jgi:hypothetical protein
MKLSEFAKDKQLDELNIKMPTGQQVGSVAAKGAKGAMGIAKAAGNMAKWMASPTLGKGPSAGGNPPAGVGNDVNDIKADMAEKKKEIQDMIKAKEQELMDLRQTAAQIK